MSTTGLCSECSTKLNYRSQKREVKRKKTLKRLGQNYIPKEVLVSSEDPEIQVKQEPESEAESVSTEEKLASESQIWKENPTDNKEKSREEKFEEYLEDLFF